MDRNLTVGGRGLVLGATVVVALVAAYLGGNLHGSPAHASDPSTETRTITVTGEGHASVVPDELTFNLTVDLTRDTIDAAMADTNAAMQHVLDTLDSQGVAKKDVQTTDVELQPVYNNDKNGNAGTIRGYEVIQTVTVTVEKLADGSRVISAAVAAGGTGVRLDGISLQVSDPSAALSPARAAAYQQAKAKAQEYAADAGGTLGEVVRVSEVNDQPVPVDAPYAMDSSSGSAASVPIQAGQDDLTAQVTVVFELQ